MIHTITRKKGTPRPIATPMPALDGLRPDVIARARSILVSNRSCDDDDPDSVVVVVNGRTDDILGVVTVEIEEAEEGFASG